MAYKPKEDEQYYFIAKLKYAAQYSGKPVTVRVAGEICSICETEEGKTFAAMNDELSFISPEEERQTAY